MIAGGVFSAESAALFRGAGESQILCDEPTENYRPALQFSSALCSALVSFSSLFWFYSWRFRHRTKANRPNNSLISHVTKLLNVFCLCIYVYILCFLTNYKTDFPSSILQLKWSWKLNINVVLKPSRQLFSANKQPLLTGEHSGTFSS